MKKIFSIVIAILLLTGCDLTITIPRSDVMPALTSTGAAFTPTPPPTLTPIPKHSFPSSTVTASGSLSFRIPILMYHHVGTYPKNADQVRRNLTLSTKSFEEQLKILAKKGYQSITFADIEAGSLPKKPIMLTFDDGYDDNFENAFPLLETYKQKGIFYIITDKADTPGYMTWAQITEMHAAGHEIGSHTRTHPDLKVISYDDKKLEQEVIESKKILGDKGLGPIISFCYPSGAFNEKVVNLAEKYYHFARTTLSGVFTNTTRRGKLPMWRMQEGVDLNELLK